MKTLIEPLSTLHGLGDTSTGRSLLLALHVSMTLSTDCQ